MNMLAVFLSFRNRQNFTVSGCFIPILIVPQLQSWEAMYKCRNWVSKGLQGHLQKAAILGGFLHNTSFWGKVGREEDDIDIY